MKKFIPIIVIVLIVAVILIAFFYFKKSTPQTSAPSVQETPQASNVAERPTGTLSFDTNDNIDQALDDLKILDEAVIQ